MTWYRMHDAPDAPKAAIPVERSEAKRWNTPEAGFGIFATVNTFDGPRRKENLRRINAWPVDIDDGSKESQQAKILGAPLWPSMIVETKRGFQVYYCAKDGKAKHWDAILQNILVPYFGADKNARDLCRILRVAGFLHLKDPSSPFLIRMAYQRNVAYTEQQIVKAFPWVQNKTAHVEQRREVRAATSHDAGEDFWEAVFKLDHGDALERLSGSHYVNGERFTFRHCTNGNKNILVDGKGTSCFVDDRGRIGSLSGGGPLITNWLRWYGNDWKQTLEAVKGIYPHLAEIDAKNKQARRAA